MFYKRPFLMYYSTNIW